MSIIPATTSTVFTADGVLFDMDGTLTDSIAAVEAAWTAKAVELGLEPAVVIAATHGRRASDNLRELVPSLKIEEVDQEVDRFERSILAFADTPPHSRKSSFAASQRSSISASTLDPLSPATPSDKGGLSSADRQPVLTDRDLFSALQKYQLGGDDDVPAKEGTDAIAAGDEEEEIVDMGVRILPGVRNLINSLPEGTYAVATSGAKTYCHGCLNRTGITIPKVCVTADDSRLLRGKPFPDPFLLAASDLGIDAKQAVVFEDSPSGIKAAVAAGSTVIAVCTSHRREQISNLGAHFIVDTMDQVKVKRLENGRLEFTITQI